MRKEPLITGEYYHIYNRGVDKRDIFNTLKDLERFKESIKHFNQVEGIVSLNDYRKFLRASIENPDTNTKLKSKPLVAIVALCINPNHFHFMLKQLVEGGVAKFMQKLQGGYTYYFNQKYQRSGSLLQGTFKSKLIKNDNYGDKTFGYVNKNYQVHDIPQNKLQFVFASDVEYEQESFDFVSKTEGRKMLEIFGGRNNLKQHCQEIISIIREERGKTSLDETEELP